MVETFYFNEMCCLVCRTRADWRKTNTCETKGDSKQNKPNICWVVNSVCPGERKLVGCCVALFLQRWIPACLTRTLNEHKTTLCDCWLLCALITILSRRVKSNVWATDLLKQCWHCVLNRFNKRNYISVWTGFSALPKGANQVETNTK